MAIITTENEWKFVYDLLNGVISNDIE